MIQSVHVITSYRSSLDMYRSTNPVSKNEQVGLWVPPSTNKTYPNDTLKTSI